MLGCSNWRGSPKLFGGLIVVRAHRSDAKGESVKKALGLASVFASGAVVGATAMNLLDLHVRPTYREAIRADLVVEQEMSAAREARAGDRLRSAVHRWDTVDAYSPNGFRIFRREVTGEEDSDFWLPFRLLALKHIVSAADADGRGRQLIEAQYRAKLALTLEALHADRAADEQWEVASRLEGKSRDAVRRYAETSLKSEDSDLHRQAEAAILDRKSGATGGGVEPP